MKPAKLKDSKPANVIDIDHLLKTYQGKRVVWKRSEIDFLKVYADHDLIPIQAIMFDIEQRKLFRDKTSNAIRTMLSALRNKETLPGIVIED